MAVARFVLVTQNPAKLEEIRKILGPDLKHHSGIELPEVLCLEVRDVVALKARRAYEVLNIPVMVEDTGLFIRAWGGLPGALIKWFHRCVGEPGICKMMMGFSDRAAVVKTVVGVYDGRMEEPLLFSGEIEGEIAMEPAGERSFGFDSIFIPAENNELRLTFAQMGERKNEYSMRRKAFEKVQMYFSHNGVQSSLKG